jgi:hypothetical protein
VRLSVSKAGKVTATLKVTKAGRGRLAHATVKLSSVMSFTPTGGRATTVTKRFTLRR